MMFKLVLFNDFESMLLHKLKKSQNFFLRKKIMGIFHLYFKLAFTYACIGTGGNYNYGSLESTAVILSLTSGAKAKCLVNSCTCIHMQLHHIWQPCRKALPSGNHAERHCHLATMPSLTSIKKAQFIFFRFFPKICFQNEWPLC